MWCGIDIDFSLGVVTCCNITIGRVVVYDFYNSVYIEIINDALTNVIVESYINICFNYN